MASRLLTEPPAGGAWNMAVDEALLISAASGQTATLRFYGWSEPTVSLGYFQRLHDRYEHDPAAVCPVVRRSTGGGAIVHDNELTYSIVLPRHGQFKDATRSLYQALHLTLVQTLGSFGLECELFVPGQNQARGLPFLCFQRRTEGDVLFQGNKIAGSAQRRHKGSVLQHGSVLLGKSPHAMQLPGLQDLTNTDLDICQMKSTWIRMLGEQLGLDFVGGQLTSPEVACAKALVVKKYGQARWTARR